MNVYLISFTSLTQRVSRGDLQDFFDSRFEILNWFGIMPQAILVVTNTSESRIASLLINKFGNDITFLITKTEPNVTQGYINSEVWEFINNPKASGAKPVAGLLGNN